MYEIKKSPEDFIVREVNSITPGKQGKFAICLLKKRNYTTQRAIDHLASKLNKNISDFSFAGTKDKNAVTTQYISIKNIGKDKLNNLNLKDIEVTFLGYSNKPISLGQLEGNEFTITVYTKLRPVIRKTMPNHFGEQRFSKNNIEIGRLLIKNRFREAVELILKSD